MNAACWQVYETCWPLVVHALGAVVERHHVYDIHELYAQSSCCVPVVFLLPQTSAAHQTPERCSTMGLHCDLVVLSTACTIWLFKPMQSPVFLWGSAVFGWAALFYFFFFQRGVRNIAVFASVCFFVCLFVCLFVSAWISQKPHVQTSQNSPYMLCVAVAQSSTDDSAMRYVLPVLSMTSCFHIMGQIQIKAGPLANSLWLVRWRQSEACYRRLPRFSSLINIWVRSWSVILNNAFCTWSSLNWYIRNRCYNRHC